MEKDGSYIVYEGTMARFERIIKRLIAVIIILLYATRPGRDCPGLFACIKRGGCDPPLSR